MPATSAPSRPRSLASRLSGAAPSVLLAVATLAALSACGGDPAASEALDAAATDDTATLEASAEDTSDSSAPDTTAPDTAAPDTTAPDTSAPDTTAPDTSAPDTTAPDTADSAPLDTSIGLPDTAADTADAATDTFDAADTNPCAAVTCTTPPAATCADAKTRRTYAATGTCSAGTCSYASTDTACTSPQVCLDGACSLCPILTVACPAGCCAVPSVDVAPAGRWPSVAIDAAGYVYVGFTIVRSTAWGEGLSIYDPTTATWSTREIGLGGYASRVLVSATGRVHHLFGGATTPVTYRYSDDRGANWTTRTVSTTSAIGGTLDLAVGAGDVPHVVFQNSTSSVWSSLVYAVGPAGGATWTKTVLDPGTTENDHPSLSLAFADRPHVFSDAYQPAGATGSAIRHVWYDGAAWQAENVDAGKAYATASDYYATVRSTAYPDDSLRAVYTRTVSGTVELVRADRTPGATGTWTLTVVPGAPTTIKNPIFVDAVASLPAVIADGITSYRPNASGTFVATPASFVGTGPGVAVRGKTVFVAYQSTASVSNGHLFFSRLDY